MGVYIHWQYQQAASQIAACRCILNIDRPTINSYACNISSLLACPVSGYRLPDDPTHQKSGDKEYPALAAMASAMQVNCAP